MSEPSESPSGPAALWPFLGALAIIVAVVIGIWLLNAFSGDQLTDDQQIARAASGQNDALQRQDYVGFVGFTCAEQQSSEDEILSRQRDSVAKRGERIVDTVAGVKVDGDRATADITYYFDKDRNAKETVGVPFAREDGTWKVCSTGPS